LPSSSKSLKRTASVAGITAPPPSSQTTTTTTTTTAGIANTPSTNDEDDSQQQQPLDDVADKRRRNTAASARFRAKKKLKEMALERSAKDMSTQVEILSRRLTEYEMEIKWLRQLVTSGAGSASLKEVYEQNGVDYFEGTAPAGQGPETFLAMGFNPATMMPIVQPPIGK
ncbi:hypothetical protein HDU76_011162, partial [Blyttiomyces sp. JEL0837]